MVVTDELSLVSLLEPLASDPVYLMVEFVFDIM